MFNISTANFQTYSDTIQQLPVLSEQEETTLLRQYHIDNDLDAAKTLVLHNIRFVMFIAKDYLMYGATMSDLVQEGTIGLMKAVKSFNINESAGRFITYAVKWIKSEMMSYLRSIRSLVKLPEGKRLRKAYYKLSKVPEMNNTEINKIAEQVGANPKDVSALYDTLYSTQVDVDLLGEDESLLDEYSNPEDALIDSNHHDAVMAALSDAMETLNEREAYIIKARWNNDGKVTLQELSDHLGVSIERVRQIEKRAMEKLKQHIITVT